MDDDEEEEERMKNDYEQKEIDSELIFIVDARCALCSANDSFIRDLFYLFSLLSFSPSIFPNKTKRFKDARLILKYYEFFFTHSI